MNRDRLRWAAFFLLAFLYLYCLVDPKLVFFAHGTVVKLPTFANDEALVLGVRERPGGVGEFLSAYVLRYFGRAWAGPTALALIAILLHWSADRLVASVSGKRLPGAAYVPVILFLAIAGRYDRPFFGIEYALPMTLVLVCAAAYTLAPARAVGRLFLFLILGTPVYLFGAGAVLLFGIACTVHEVFGQRRAVLGLSVLALGLVIPLFVGRFVYHAPLTKAYLRLTPLDPAVAWDHRGLHILLFALVPLLMFVCPRLRLAPQGDAPRQDMAPAWTAESLLLLLAAVGVMILLFGPDLQASLRTENERPFGQIARLPAWQSVSLLVAGLLLAALAALLYVRLPFTRGRWWVFLALAFFVHYYAAGLATLVFAVLCATHELCVKRRRLLGIGILTVLLLTGGLWLLAARDADFLEWLARTIPFGPVFDPRTPSVARRLLTALPIAAVVLAAWRACVPPEHRSAAGTHSDGIVRRMFRARLGPIGGWCCSSLLLIAVAGTAAGSLFDWDRHARLRLHYLARMERWGDVLTEVRYLHDPDGAARLGVTLALYETGHLADDMFAFPYSRLGLGAAPSWEEMSLYAGIYFEMGYLNAAEEFAFANLVVGDHPLVLRQLGRLYLAKNRPDTARVFYDALRHDKSCRRWAEEYDPAHIPSGPATLAPMEDRTFSEYPRDQMRNVADFLEANPGNRMALEFTMAWLLLQRHLDEFAENLSRVKAAGCRGKLRLYQEAFLVHADNPGAETGELEIAPETRRRFREFREEAALADGHAGRMRLARKFGDTYFFYHRFGERLEH
ncbi:MAG: DUF6057 family protein [Planctomycetota bacterium]